MCARALLNPPQHPRSGFENLSSLGCQRVSSSELRRLQLLRLDQSSSRVAGVNRPQCRRLIEHRSDRSRINKTKKGLLARRIICRNALARDRSPTLLFATRLHKTMTSRSCRTPLDQCEKNERRGVRVTPENYVTLNGRGRRSRLISRDAPRDLLAMLHRTSPWKFDRIEHLNELIEPT